MKYEIYITFLYENKLQKYSLPWRLTMQSGTSNKFFYLQIYELNQVLFYFFQWWIKQNIFKHLWKHTRLLNKYPQWIVRTLHSRSLFKRLKSYIVVVELHFLTRLKALGLKYFKVWFPWSRLSWKNSKKSYSTRPFKKCLF